MQAIEKCLPRSLPRSEAYWGEAYWGFDMKPEIFKQKPLEFKNIILALKIINEPSFHKQPCET